MAAMPHPLYVTRKQQEFLVRDTKSLGQSAPLKGFILLGVIFFGIFILHRNGLVTLLLQGDKSYLSYAILSLWLLATLRWLWLLHWCQVLGEGLPTQSENQEGLQSRMERWLNHGWFAADMCLKIGLLGTIVGFILMLSPIRDLAAFDPANLQNALKAMSGGMAVALYTTLAGLACHILLRLQYQLLADQMHLLLNHLPDAADDRS